MFGDVNLRLDPIREIHGENIPVGSGGWPYMRYFNSETGYTGRQYEKQTNDRICVELSKDNFKYMRQYVNDFAPASRSEL